MFVGPLRLVRVECVCVCVLMYGEQTFLTHSTRQQKTNTFCARKKKKVNNNDEPPLNWIRLYRTLSLCRPLSVHTFCCDKKNSRWNVGIASAQLKKDDTMMSRFVHTQSLARLRWESWFFCFVFGGIVSSKSWWIIYVTLSALHLKFNT